MKKWMSLVLAAMLLFSLAGCGKPKLQIITQTTIPVNPMYLGNVCQGYACVVHLDDQRSSFVYIDTAGNQLSENTYDFASDFEENGKALVCKQNKYFYINTDGTVLSEASVSDFTGSDYSMFYERDEKKGLKDENNQPITEPIFVFVEGFSTKNLNEYVLAEYEKDGGFASCLINRQGQQISLPYNCSSAYVQGDYIHCTLTEDGKKRETVLNMNGKDILQKTYDLVKICDKNYFAIIQDGKLGLLNSNGAEVVPPSISCDYSPDMNIGYGEGYLTISINGCLAFVQLQE